MIRQRSFDTAAGAALVCLWLAAGCGTRGTLYSAPLKPLPLLGTPAGLVQVVPQTRRAVVVQPESESPAAIRISANARQASAVPGGTLVAILAGTARAPLLDLVDVSGGQVETLPCPGFFDAASWSPEGRYGVFSYVAGAGTGALSARNLNEVALLDVEARSLQRIQLDTESLAPRAVIFGPEEPSRRLVAVALERGVAVFDARRPELRPRRISLRAQGSTAETSVLEAFFSRDAHWLFVRASGVDDVVVIELGPEVGEPVSAAINFVAGGRGLTDIAPAPAAFRDAVLAAYTQSREAFLLDARGIQDFSRRLPLTDSVGAIHPLTGSRVLLTSGSSQTVTAWDVEDGRSGSAVLDGASSGVVVIPGQARAIFPHAQVVTGTGAGPSLSVVTVEDAANRLRARIQSIQLARPLSAFALDGSAQRLFFAVAPGTAVVTLELSTLQLAEVSLDAAPSRLFHLGEGDWVAAEHQGGGLGDVTFVPAGSSERAGARRFVDFAITEDLDRPEDAR